MGRYSKQDATLWTEYPRGVWVDMKLFPDPCDNMADSILLVFDLLLKGYDAGNDSFRYSREVCCAIQFPSDGDEYRTDGKPLWKWSRNFSNQRPIAFFIHPANWEYILAVHTTFNKADFQIMFDHIKEELERHAKATY